MADPSSGAHQTVLNPLAQQLGEEAHHQRRIRQATDLSGQTSEDVARSDAGLPLTQSRRKVCSTNFAQFKIYLESQLETFKNKFVFL